MDVEEAFHSSTFSRLCPVESWDRLPSRVEDQTSRLLELLGQYGQVATFFVLGWVAERHPRLIRRIAEAGHEIASHGQLHLLAYELGPDRFREDVRRSKRTLEEITGHAVTGHRAASFSITPRSLWAFDVLAEEGFAYDSSVYPVRHHRYGIPSSPVTAHRRGRISELPITTVKLGPAAIGLGGGAYMRFMPATVWLAALHAVGNRRPLVLYVHPWECDPEQPKLPGPWLSRLRQYGGQQTTMPKLQHLFGRFRFRPFRELASATNG